MVRSLLLKLKVSSAQIINNESTDSPFRVVCGVLDLLSQRELITTHAGADCIHALHRGEVEPLFRYKINRDANFKVLVQVLEIGQHVRVLDRKQNYLCKQV